MHLPNLIIPVILSGGSGSRLWPLSRSLRPKQFLSLNGKESLFQLTLERLRSLNPNGELAPIIVANNDHRFLVAEQCHEIGVHPSKLILEPIARNTAPAIAVAAIAAMEYDALTHYYWCCHQIISLLSPRLLLTLLALQN